MLQCPDISKNLRRAAGNGRPPRSILLKLKDSSSSKQAAFQPLFEN